jgi:hypothetical protein
LLVTCCAALVALLCTVAWRVKNRRTFSLAMSFLHCLLTYSALFLFAGLWLSSLLEIPHVQGCRGGKNRICVSTVIHCSVEKVSMWPYSGASKELCGLHDMPYKVHLFYSFIHFTLYFRKILWFITIYTHKFFVQSFNFTCL